jgi:hypothetical protein
VPYLCSICVRVRAYDWQEIDGRLRPVCLDCDTEVPEPELLDNLTTPKDRILYVVRRNPGLTFVDIRQKLGMPGGGCHKAGRAVRSHQATAANTYARALKRMADRGEVVREGAYPNYTYRLAQQQKRAA